MNRTEKMLYYAKRMKARIEELIKNLEQKLRDGSAAASKCSLEQTVKDAAVINKEEACDILDLACQDLDECLSNC